MNARGSEIQTVLFPRDEWNEASSRSWLLAHGFRADKVDHAPGFLRWRQKPPRMGAKYWSKTLANGVHLVGFAPRRLPSRSL